MVRIERDSLGDIEVPEHALYGAQTQRAVDNFQIAQRPMPMAFLEALAWIKLTAAKTNRALNLLNPDIEKSIVQAAQLVLEGNHWSEFPVDVFQTGSGTSSNMNMNEVLAHLASKESKTNILANDHVNMSQSSNDTIPTAIHVSVCLQTYQKLIPSLNDLIKTIEKKAQSLKKIVKTGRTHLMDAMPIRFDQELLAWSAQLVLVKQHIDYVLSVVSYLPQGGTAVGTGINAPQAFKTKFAEILSQQTKFEFSAVENPMAGIAGQDRVLELSSCLNELATVVMKISNDLRWMNSGPLAGLGEISLPALQPGSSIMPGKVNPVIPEACAMAAVQVMGCHTSTTLAVQSSNFQLNVMLPIIAVNVLDSIRWMTQACHDLSTRAVQGFEVNTDNIQRSLEHNPILVTALNPLIGYETAALIAKSAYQTKRPILEVALEHTDLSEKELKRLLDPKALTNGGIMEK